MQNQFLERMVEGNLVKHQIESYNRFVQERIQKILNNVGEIKPDLPGGEELVIKLGDVEIGQPIVKEADGSMLQINPNEARMRDLSYSARVNVEMTPIFEGIKQPTETVTIGEIPVMVGSDICPTSDMTREELIEAGEDPDDPGGYFIINGSEKVIVSMEELVNNKPIYQYDGEEESCRINSEREGYVQRHVLNRKSDGVVNISFANVKKTPAVVIMKACGLETDKEIVEEISDEYAGDVYLNIYGTDVETQEDAIDFIGRKSGINRNRQERVEEILDRYLLPHIGREPESREEKARYLGTLVKNVLALNKGDIQEDDMDHYANKRLNLAGDLLEMQFRSVFLGKWGFVARMKYNFQKSAKRGRLPTLQSTVVSNTMTSQIMAAMATGNWVGGRTGVCQRLERGNRIKTLSHLRQVNSPLSSERQHFEARDLHPTQWGRIGPIKTPEGMNIGLRTHLAMAANVSTGMNEMQRNSLTQELEDEGVET